MIPDCSIPMNNYTYCYMNPIQQINYQLNSYTPIGIKLWILMALGIGIVFLWSLTIGRKMFEDKKEMEK